MKERAAGKAIGLILVGGIFAFVTTMMAQERIGEIRRGWESDAWPTTAGEVTHSQVIRRGGSRSSSTLFFEVRYEVDGRQFTTDRVAFTLVWKRGVVDRYPAGSRVTVAYDPEDPATAVVEPGVSIAGAVASLAPMILFGGVGLAMIGFGIRSALT